MSQFSRDLNKIIEARKLDLATISRTVPLRVFSAVARDTRVDTGRLRGNWQVAVGAPVLTETDRHDKNEGAPLAATEAAKVEKFALNYLTNNLVYAPVWEEKDAMVSRAVADFKRIVSEEAARL